MRYIKNSFDLVNKLRELHIDSECRLASLDVISLFTNIPVEIANSSLVKRWKFIKNNMSIPQNEFLITVNLILNSTFFSFNNIIYKQIFGTPMDSPVSPIIADIVILRSMRLRSCHFSSHFTLHMWTMYYLQLSRASLH